MAVGMQNALHIEVTYKDRAYLPCVDMEAVVDEILPDYNGRVIYSLLEIRGDAGRQRYLELSCALFGEKGVYQHQRTAPVPGLFIDGELVFDAIPPRDELEEAIAERLAGA